MGFNDLEVKKQPPLMGDGALLLLLSLNFVMLAFFILLNSIATRDTHHASQVLGSVREGYNVKGAAEDGIRGLPWVARDRWQQDIAGRMQGLVVNRLKLRTVPLEVDSERLVMELPRNALFNGPAFVGAELVRDIMAAAGAEASLQWRIRGSWQDTEALANDLLKLAAVTGKAEATGGSAEPVVEVIFMPGAGTTPEAAGAVQRLGATGGANKLQGETSVGE